MLTDKERRYAAHVARQLQAKIIASKTAKMTAVSGDVSCYLSGMTEDKKADMGFYRADQDGLFMRKRKLKDEIDKLKKERPMVIIRVTTK
jgi:hypothetical protein